MTSSICLTMFITASLFGVISTRCFQSRAQLVSPSILISNLDFFPCKITKIDFFGTIVCGPSGTCGTSGRIEF